MHAGQAGAARAVVFDFDGLLMDTESTSFLSWRYEWGQWGLTLRAADFFVNHGGDVTEDRYAALAAAVGPRFDRALSHRRRVAYREKLHEELDLTDGLREWLDEAAGLGLRLAVASSSPVDWLTTHLGRAGVLGMFEVLAGGDEVGRHKPAPDVYQLALDRLTLDCAAAVAVEDTAHGVAAAHAAGLRCIAIPNPFVPLERVRDADLVLTSASQLRLADALSQLS
ncbi:MAG TPA: HAD-IA family hydrolase [Streptosporangiaceae bacterium]|nr:HAD-IA family hydrolase [Streptosporangiaceae bacterium]